MNLKGYQSLNRDQSSLVDKELFLKGFSIDQLMELAGLSVSQVVHDVHPLSKGSRILVLAGPGKSSDKIMKNRIIDVNIFEEIMEEMVGLDLSRLELLIFIGLVTARHLWHYGYKLSVYYPKKGRNELFDRLCMQLDELSIPFVSDVSLAMKETDHIIDAIFGFNFSGEIRDPFVEVIDMLKHTEIPVTSIDIPSGWDIEKNPFENGETIQWCPTFLISLTAPKPCSQYFKGRHFIGGRFITPSIMRKYNLSPIKYDGYKQYAEITGIPIENDLK